jgi:hypothetical protein
VAVTFIASELVTFQVKFAEQSKELADRVHGVFAAPGVNYFGSVTVAEGQHGFVTGSGEIAKGSRPAGNVLGWILDQSSHVLVRDHGVTFIVEPLGAVLDPEDVVFEVLSIGFRFPSLLEHIRKIAKISDKWQAVYSLSYVDRGLNERRVTLRS